MDENDSCTLASVAETGTETPEKTHERAVTPTSSVHSASDGATKRRVDGARPVERPPRLTDRSLGSEIDR
jgi:hypothetical protein